MGQTNPGQVIYLMKTEWRNLKMILSWGHVSELGIYIFQPSVSLQNIQIKLYDFSTEDFVKTGLHNGYFTYTCISGKIMINIHGTDY